jgi:DNA polymerase elongation subunit (family B)
MQTSETGVMMDDNKGEGEDERKDEEGKDHAHVMSLIQPCLLEFPAPSFPEIPATATYNPCPPLFPDDVDHGGHDDTGSGSGSGSETRPRFLDFCLLSVDLRDGAPRTYHWDHVTNDTALVTADIMHDAKEHKFDDDVGEDSHGHGYGHDHDSEGGDNEDAPLLDPQFQAPCFAYLTGHTATGAKVGLVVPARPGFYIEGPPADLRPHEIMDHRGKVEKAVGRVALQLTGDAGALHVTWLEGCRFNGYVPTPTAPARRRVFWFAHVTAPNAKAARAAAGKLRYRLPRAFDGQASIHEDGIDVEQAFLDVHGLTPCGWHRVPLHVLGAVPAQHRQLLVHYEFDMALDCSKSPGWWPQGLPLRPFQRLATEQALPSYVLAAVDAEMTSGASGRFPKSFRAEDAVVVVSVVFAYGGGDAPGRPAGHVFERHAFVLGAEEDMDPIPGVRLHFFPGDEVGLLGAVRDELFVHKHADIVTGHNIVTFDMKYLAERAGGEVFVPGAGAGAAAAAAAAAAAGAAKKALHSRFLRFGALLREVCVPRLKRLTSSAFGANDLVLLFGVGFVYVDSMLLCKLSPAKLRENTLKAACAHFLPSGATKHDMPYEAIPGIVAHGSRAQKAALAGYCVQDSVLVIELLEKWNTVRDLVAQSRIINILMAVNVLCGQQQRVRDTLMLKARACSPPMVMNGVNARGERRWDDSAEGAGGAERVIADGGYVLDAKVGFYDVGVGVVDFASLYPSVQRSRNLCWSTVVSQEVYDALSPHARMQLGIDTYDTATGTFHFVTTVPGVFPRQLKDLLDARNTAKAEMKAAQQAREAAEAAGDRAAAAAARAAYDNADYRQRATKIVMNSGYGTANSEEGKGVMPCRAVGTTTCSEGAKLNKQAQQVLLAAPFNAEILYGDTDSLMFRFPPEPGADPSDRAAALRHVFRQGEAAEAAINAMFNDIEARVLARRRAALDAAGASGPSRQDVASVLASEKPVKVELEKVYFPYLLLAKKVYAGVEHTAPPPADAPKDLGTLGAIKPKGLKTVRRDVALFAKHLTMDLLHAMLRQRSEAAFWRVVEDVVARVCLGAQELGGGPDALPLADFCLTRELKEGYEHQTPTPPQAAVSYAKEYAAPGTGHMIGDRVPYLFVEAPDARRLRQPPWLVPDSGVPIPDRGSLPPLCLEAGGGGIKDLPKSARARSCEEVLACPEENVVDIVYYVEKVVCNVVKQLKPGPTTVTACDRCVKYAQNVAKTMASARGTPSRVRSAWGAFGFSAVAAGSATGSATTPGTGTGKVVNAQAIIATLPKLRLVAPPTPVLCWPGMHAGAGADSTGTGIGIGTGTASQLRVHVPTKSDVPVVVSTQTKRKLTASETRKNKAAKVVATERQAASFLNYLKPTGVPRGK